jgi:hypothetical protein
MRCAVVRTWLIEVDTPDGLPVEVERHLARCAPCRERWRRLVALAELTAPALPPTLPETVRASLFRALAQSPHTTDGAITSSPVPAPIAPRLPPWRKPWSAGLARLRPLWRVAAVVLLAFGIGWLIGALRSPSGESNDPTASLPRAEEMLVSRFLERDRRLAGPAGPSDQVVVFNDMAVDLCSEAVHLARQGVVEDLALLADLHRRVVRRGILGRFRDVPQDRRAPLLDETVAHLRKTENEVNEVVGSAPVQVAALIRPMSETARDARNQLNQMPLPAPEANAADVPPSATGPWRAILATLVAQGLRVAEEPDPERRADVGKQLEELERLLQVAGRAIDSMQRSRSVSKPTFELPRTFPPAAKVRVQELEKTLQDLEKVLRRMQDESEKPPLKDRNNAQGKGGP